jgi:predicted Mrr-cat superfamily restriction endonuclease
MASVWCVRAEFGTFSRFFVNGGYVAIGWMPEKNLAEIASRDELYPLYRQAYPKDTSSIVVGQQVGQIGRFLLEVRPGDYVVTPATDTERLHYGEVTAEPSYFFGGVEDGCPYPHRKRVKWSSVLLNRSDFSVPFQNTIRSSLTVFGISQREEFLSAIGRADIVPARVADSYDPYRVVLEQVLELDAKEFEILVGHLLTALGFEGSEVTGRSVDGGVDAIGEMNVGNLAKVRVFVQAKRYKLGQKIAASTVRQLRQAIPFGGQGGFITTADFQQAAREIALEQGFPRIGLVNGHQLVELLVEHWSEIPEAFRSRLGLKTWLVRG